MLVWCYESGLETPIAIMQHIQSDDKSPFTMRCHSSAFSVDKSKSSKGETRIGKKVREQ